MKTPIIITPHKEDVQTRLNNLLQLRNEEEWSADRSQSYIDDLNESIKRCEIALHMGN